MDNNSDKDKNLKKFLKLENSYKEFFSTENIVDSTNSLKRCMMEHSFVKNLIDFARKNNLRAQAQTYVKKLYELEEKLKTFGINKK